MEDLGAGLTSRQQLLYYEFIVFKYKSYSNTNFAIRTSNSRYSWSYDIKYMKFPISQA